LHGECRRAASSVCVTALASVMELTHIETTGPGLLDAAAIITAGPADSKKRKGKCAEMYLPWCVSAAALCIARAVRGVCNNAHGGVTGGVARASLSSSRNLRRLTQVQMQENP
jgi:hypothetical protein